MTRRDPTPGRRAPEPDRAAQGGSRPRAVAIVAESRMPLAAVLPRLGEDAAVALADGRVFVGTKRALQNDQIVEAGQEVVMFHARRATGDVIVLAERSGIVAVAKPASMASIPDRLGRGASLVEALASQYGSTARQWEPTSRLDVGVSGVVLFATDANARRWLARARAEHVYLRHYVAIAGRSPAPPPCRGLWEAAIGRARDPCLRRVGGRDAQEASTRYAVVAEASETGAALLGVEPQTGRTHQIRVHAAHAGAPLVGDAAYGGMTRLVEPTGAVHPVRRIALHAAWVEVPPAPRSTEAWRIEAPVDEELRALWAALSGDPAAWERALDRLS